MSSCIDRSGEGDSQGFAPAGLFAFSFIRLRKTISAHENFDGPLVCHNNSRTVPQEAPKVPPAKPFQFSLPLFRGAAEAALYCAHRTSTVSSCAFCEQEGHLAAPPMLADFFSLLLFRYEDQHPRRGLFDHVRKPSGGTTGGNSWENGSTANLNGPETIGGILCWGEGEDSWNLSA